MKPRGPSSKVISIFATTQHCFCPIVRRQLPPAGGLLSKFNHHLLFNLSPPEFSPLETTDSRSVCALLHTPYKSCSHSQRGSLQTARKRDRCWPNRTTKNRHQHSGTTLALFSLRGKRPYLSSFSPIYTVIYIRKSALRKKIRGKAR